jgi:hypothetical protein
LSPRTENSRAGWNLSGNDNVCCDLRSRRNVTACQLDIMAAGQGKQAAQEAIYPRLREIGRKSEREETCQRFAAHGRDVAQAAGKAAVPYDCGRVPGSAEMDIFNTEIGCDQKLKSRFEPKHSAVVANSCLDRTVGG